MGAALAVEAAEAEVTAAVAAAWASPVYWVGVPAAWGFPEYRVGLPAAAAARLLVAVAPVEVLAADF